MNDNKTKRLVAAVCTAAAAYVVGYIAKSFIFGLFFGAAGAAPAFLTVIFSTLIGVAAFTASSILCYKYVAKQAINVGLAIGLAIAISVITSLLSTALMMVLGGALGSLMTIINIALNFGAAFLVGLKARDLSQKELNASAFCVSRPTVGFTNLDRYFVECVLAGCDDFSQPKNVEKAKLLAAKYNLKAEQGVDVLFSEGMAAHQEVTNAMNAERLATLREKEEMEFSQLDAYSQYFGRDKKIAMLTTQINALLGTASSVQQGASNFLNSTQQREHDWATHGGIASGIAGPAAGIARAAELQAQNATIRAQNQANMQAAMPLYMAMSSRAADKRAEAERLQTVLESVKEKLVGDTPAAELLAMLKIKEPSVKVSETGAFTVSAEVSLDRPVFVFGDVPAVIDGTLVAHVLDNGAEVGIAHLVLPINGIDQKASPLSMKGMNLHGAVPGKEYTVTFTADKLWAMEK